jgi:phosphoribosylformylglycinamidine cyclo-ligase
LCANGGETAEMPSLYNNGEYDVSGTIIGIVEKDKIITGANIKSGNFLLDFHQTAYIQMDIHWQGKYY